MIRTIKLPYGTVPQAAELIARWRKAQSVVVRIAYNQLREGKTDKEILGLLRTRPQGRLDSWLTLSALKKAKTVHKAHPQAPVVFGGKRQFQLRAQGKITRQEWRARRLLPLYLEGHAQSYGEQGGNHKFVLDIANNRVLFYPKAKVELPLSLKLGKSNYRELLEELEQRCTCWRDTPFSVSLTESHISISWESKDEPTKLQLNPERALSFDLNPNRIGIAVLERTPAGCRVLHWEVYENATLSRKLRLAPDHPGTVHQRNKRVYELSQIASEIQQVAVHYQCGTLVSEHLNVQTKDHRKGKSFNRAVNNQWSRRGFILPLLRRLETVGIQHAEVNPAYSSKMGNRLWGWGDKIPDPACAAVELGRRFLQEDPKQWSRKDGGNRRKEARQVQAKREQSPDAQAHDHWKRVWNQLNPKPGDTPRLTIPVLKEQFPDLCPSPSPFRAPQSLVVRFEPARICHKMRITMRSYL
jgi:IS605 OrfB family transposase